MTKFEITWLEDRSDEGVLAEIRRVAALEPNLRLTVERFDAVARIKSSAVRARFGSWSEATRRAGLSDALPIYSRDALIDDLKRVSTLASDEPFTVDVYKHYGRYSVSHVKRAFSGWREALSQAGLSSRYTGPVITDRMKAQIGRTMTDSEILDRIRKVAKDLGKSSISGEEIAANSEISQSQMYRRFGGVSAALKKAGIEQVPHGRRYTEEEIFDNLLNVWTNYGRPPTALEMDTAPSIVGKNAYLIRYGGWRAALKAFVERANSEAERSPDSDIHTNPKADVERAPEAQTTAVQISNIESINSAKSALRPPVRRRAMQPNVQPEDRRDPSIGLRFRVLQRDNFKCVLCGDHPARNAGCILHVDHILPWSKGGKTTEDNLRALCAVCNIGRGNRFSD